MWKEKINEIDVKTSNNEDKTLFYTSLYRVFLSPFLASNKENHFLATNGTIQNALDYDYYTSW